MCDWLIFIFILKSFSISPLHLSSAQCISTVHFKMISMRTYTELLLTPKFGQKLPIIMRQMCRCMCTVFGSFFLFLSLVLSVFRLHSFCQFSVRESGALCIFFWLRNLHFFFSRRILWIRSRSELCHWLLFWNAPCAFSNAPFFSFLFVYPIFMLPINAFMLLLNTTTTYMQLK